MSNRLNAQSSPYLQQHAKNPVDWFPWCEEAFEKASREDKPIFLSIGYSTCHWCHVMAHESFSSPEIAKILNQYFISIKVDREERPDIDSVYMSVCQAFTGSGGWPMSIFMTCEQKPFFAGTYFPPESRHGIIGFDELLLTIANRWKTKRLDLLTSADQILSALQNKNNTFGTNHTQDLLIANHKCGTLQQNAALHLPKQAADLFSQSYDHIHGGFGPAPKFPLPHNLLFLLLYAKLRDNKTAARQALHTLKQMRKGGIFDQIGYGFSRYSTDVSFFVPHFEKMLYDNALLIIAYAAAYQSSGDASFLHTAIQTGDYVLEEMTGPNGEFFSAQDADSDGEEGKYYTWSYDEICRILGEDKGTQYCRYFGITKEGNFEGKNIPHMLHSNDAVCSHSFEAERKRLYKYRKARSKLHLDDKVLTSWNALMICAFSILYRVSGQPRCLKAAQKAQSFLDRHLTDGSFLYVSYRNGKHSSYGFLDDYAYETAALLCLYESSADKIYLERAKSVCLEAFRQFADTSGGYFLYGTNNDSLIVKPKECYDGALPSGNSVIAYCLVRLSQLTADEEKSSFRQMAEKQLSFLSEQAAHYPAGYSLFLIALLFYANPPQKITVVLSKKDSAEQILPQLPLYADLTILRQAADDYKLLNEKTTYYVCKNYTCLPPSNSFSSLI